MTDKTSIETSRDQEMFPMTPAQISRIAAHGHLRQVEQGEVLVEAGEQTARLFVVTAGQIETAAMSGTAEEIAARSVFDGKISRLQREHSQSLTGCGDRAWDRRKPRRAGPRFSSLASWSRS